MKRKWDYSEMWNSWKVQARKSKLYQNEIVRRCVGEVCGTTILLVFGLGVLCQVMLSQEDKLKHGSFISISTGWGWAVTMGVFFGGRLGHGLINPAVTLAFAVIGKVKWKLVIPYTLSQLFGAWLGALLVYANYFPKIGEFGYNMTATGSMFVSVPHTSAPLAFYDQLLGTFLLTAGALTIVDAKGWDVPDYLHPVFLGVLVWTIVGAFALNAGAPLNPARDIGPRIMMAMCGWGSEAFTYKNFHFLITTAGQYIGAVLGALLYEIIIGVYLTKVDETEKPDSGDKIEPENHSFLDKNKQERKIESNAKTQGNSPAVSKSSDYISNRVPY